MQCAPWVDQTRLFYLHMASEWPSVGITWSLGLFILRLRFRLWRGMEAFAFSFSRSLSRLCLLCDHCLCTHTNITHEQQSLKVVTEKETIFLMHSFLQSFFSFFCEWRRGFKAEKERLRDPVGLCLQSMKGAILSLFSSSLWRWMTIDNVKSETNKAFSSLFSVLASLFPAKT